MKKILVIEDKPEHLADARRVLEERVNAGAIGGATFCETLDGALEELNKNQYGGILSDVFFPEYKGGEERPSGVKVCEYALQHRIPLVLVTDTNHHGSKLQPIHNWLSPRQITMCDASGDGDEGYALKRLPGGGYDLENPTARKRWTSAYSQLCNLIVIVDRGFVEITPRRINRICDPPDDAERDIERSMEQTYLKGIPKERLLDYKYHT